MIGHQQILKLRDGVEIHCDVREIGSPLWLIVTHGIGEHKGRHHYISDLFGHTFNIFYYDLRGHGKSKGDRADVSSFSLYRDDLIEVIDFIKAQYRMERYMLFGHSMGALIISDMLQANPNLAPYPEKIFLSTPPVGIGGPAGIFARKAPLALLKGLASLPVGLKLPKLVDLNDLSHDPRIKREYINDSLNCLKLHTRLVFELAATSRTVFASPLNLKCQAYVAVGSKDRITYPPSVEHFFTTVEKNVQFKIIEGAYHEMHNEIEKYRGPYFSFLKESLSDRP